MPKIDVENMIHELTTLTEEVLNFTVSLTHSPMEQLLRKSAPTQWNLLECIAHLNFYSAFYNRAIAESMQGAKKQAIKAFRTGCLGQYFAQSMFPKPAMKKIQTFKVANFINQDIHPDAIDIFIKYQRELLALIEKAKDYNLEKLKCPITISKWIKLKLGDTLRFHVYHNYRHLKQMQKIVSRHK